MLFFTYSIFLQGTKTHGLCTAVVSLIGVYMSEYVGESTQGLYFIIFFLNGEEANVFCCTLQMR
jgi:hypothetical protein